MSNVAVNIVSTRFYQQYIRTRFGHYLGEHAASRARPHDYDVVNRCHSALRCPSKKRRRGRPAVRLHVCVAVAIFAEALCLRLAATLGTEMAATNGAGRA